MILDMEVRQSAIHKAKRYAADELGFETVGDASRKSPKLFEKIYLERFNYLMSQLQLPIDCTHVQVEMW